MPYRKDPSELDHTRDGAGVLASKDASPDRKGWRGRDILVRLHPTLVSIIGGLVLLTALSIGGSAALLTLYNTRTEIKAAQQAAVGAATRAMEQFLGTLPQITEAFASAAHRGALPLENRERLLAIFAEQVRASQHVAWAGYGDATGWYAGATRTVAGEIVEYTAEVGSPDEPPKQVAVALDGSRSTPIVVETEPFRVLTRDWFKLGISTPGSAWSDVYPFPSGGHGITCVTRVIEKGATAPTGVFHIDLRLAGIDDFLSTLRIGPRGAVFLVDREGHPFIAPAGAHVGAAKAAVDAAATFRKKGQEKTSVTVTTGDGTYDVTFDPLVDIKGNIGFSIAVVIDLADITDSIQRNTVIAGAIGLAAVILAMLCAIRLASVISRPVVAIAADLARVGNFDISREPSPRSLVREITELGHSADRMKASLRSFAHYVPTDLVRRLIATGAEAELGGEIRRLTIHFSDVADFTSISEGMEPLALVQATGRYFELMTTAITRHGGTVDKFMGDGIMAFFNAPQELPGHPREACLAALEAQQMLADMERETPAGQPVFRARIGLGLGEVLVGNIGTRERFAYTLLGDEVNLASRLEGLNKIYGTRIMACATVIDETGDTFEWRRLDRVAVKGRHQGTLVCELLGTHGTVASDILHARDLYEAGLAAYFAGDFEPAERAFDAAARARPTDLAAPTMRDRCREIGADPPANWDGIHIMHEK